MSILGNDLLLANLARMISTISEGIFLHTEIADTARDNIAEIVESKDYNRSGAGAAGVQPLYRSPPYHARARAELATYNIQPSQYRVLGVAVSMVNVHA